MKRIYILLIICLCILGAFSLANFVEGEITGKAVNIEVIGGNPDMVTTSGTVSLRILDPDKIKEYNLEVEGGSFDDGSIWAKEGDYLILKVSSDKDCMFTILLLGVEIELKEGKEATLEFDVPSKGAYDFYCGDVEGKLKIRKKLFGLF